MNENSWLRIEFPRGISPHEIPRDRAKLTCEDVKWLCLEYLKNSGLLCDMNSEEPDLVNLLSAFGLVAVNDESVWLSPSDEFTNTNVTQVYKFRLRHRPPASKILYQYENKKPSLLSEFFFLQALDDFLIGSLGKIKGLEKNKIGFMLTLALLFPSTLPLENSMRIGFEDRNNRFGFLNFKNLKFFSKELFKQIVTTQNKLDKWLDTYFYYKRFQTFINIWRSRNLTVWYYKFQFMVQLLETYPSYCFETFIAKDPESGENKTIDFTLYAEGKDKNGSVGIYVDKTRKCCLETIYRINYKEPHPDEYPQWVVDLECQGPKSQDFALIFDKKEVAASFVTMLQGYMNLCIRPETNICRQFTSPLAKIRDNLKSFCPMSHEEAVNLLKEENERDKDANEQCSFMIYQSEDKFKHFHVTQTLEEPICHIELEEKGFLVYASEDPQYPKEFNTANELRSHLVEKYGQQFKPAKFGVQSINQDKIFYTEQSKCRYIVPEEEKPFFNYILECDLERKKYIINNSEDDDHIRRTVVNIGEDKRMMVELSSNIKKVYMDGLYYGISKLGELYRLHSKSILPFYGPLIANTHGPAYILEHSEYGDLIQYLKRSSKAPTVLRLDLARQVVKIFCTIAQERKDLLHGNLRGHNFWLFKRFDSFTLKLGDPGLVHYYNTRELSIPNNDKRIPWLSPERRSNLGAVTVASECYAVATTIAEIFHGTDDFRSVLNAKIDDTFQAIFSSDTFQIPEPSFDRSEDEKVVQAVKNVISRLWVTLVKCWNPDPGSRPLPEELQEAISILEDDAKSIPQESVFEHTKVLLKQLYQDDQTNVNNLKSMEDCHQFFKNKDICFIEPSKLQVMKQSKLGSGQFGEVFKGILSINNSHREVAVKVNKEVNLESTESFIKEFKLCAKLDHPNIVKALCHSTTGDHSNLCMIMEYMNAESLKTYVFKNKQKKTEKTFINRLLKFAADIAEGMCYMQKERVIHGDLAARNVLLNQDSKGTMTAKLSDFGLAKVLNSGKDYYYDRRGLEKSRPIYWHPPEYYKAEMIGQFSLGINFTTAGDVWAYGVTLWEMFSSSMYPQSSITKKLGVETKFINMEMLYDLFVEHKWRLPKETVPDNVYDLMKTCWSEGDDNRPSFTEIYNVVRKLR